MIPVDKLLYKLDLRLNKLAGTEHQYISIMDKILALNEAQLILVKRKLNGNNIYRSGVDSFKKRYEDLQNLIIHFEETSTEKDTSIFTSYKVDLDNLTQPYFLPLEVSASCSKNSCSNRILYLFDIVKHGDLQVMMNNNNYKPSFEYQETLGVISNNKLYIYTDTTFTVDKAYISYLKYPQKIDKAGYTNYDGVASTDSNCELSENLENELLDIAMLELAMNTENSPQVEMSNIRNNQSE